MGVQRYEMVPHLASAVEIAKEVGEEVTGVLWWCRKLAPKVTCLSGLTLFGAKHGVQRYVMVPR